MSAGPKRVFENVPPMPAPVFGSDEQKTLAVDPDVRPYLSITKEQLVGLLWALTEYAWRSSSFLENEPAVEPEAAAADPELVPAHRALIRWFWENRDWARCHAPPEPHRPLLGDPIFDAAEQYGVGHLKYTKGFERITRPELVQMLRLLGQYTARARRFPPVHTVGAPRQFSRREHAHHALVRFDDQPFTADEYVLSLRDVLAPRGSE